MRAATTEPGCRQGFSHQDREQFFPPVVNRSCLPVLVHSSHATDRVTHACFDAIAVALADLDHVPGQGIASWMKGAEEAAQPVGPGIAPSASLIRVQTFMLTMTATISSISSGLKCSASASWKR
jgi:hypothetical protein